MPGKAVWMQSDLLLVESTRQFVPLMNASQHTTGELPYTRLGPTLSLIDHFFPNPGKQLDQFYQGLRLVPTRVIGGPIAFILCFW